MTSTPAPRDPARRDAVRRSRRAASAAGADRVAADLPSLPSPAERVRSVLAAATGITVGVAAAQHPVHRHVVDLDGSLLFLAPEGSAAAAFAAMPGLPAVEATVTATDLADLPFADRVRGRVHLTGRLGPASGPVHPALLAHLQGDGDAPLSHLVRLQPTSASLQWRVEVPEGPAAAAWREVPVADVRAARADALIGSAAAWLTHLARDHGEALRALAESVRPGSTAAGTPRPLLVDRHGLVLRPATGPDLRLPFDRPATTPREAALALGRLAGVVAPRP
ncbi:DUF2470 domain-containing protein [Nocardioides perillae]|uniref:DUF2470 domain-containing protein n=1 Tax=Nocardioides perillae TaxID=1119534 RepID=A0A7Y9UUV0_9ACTN|nr:hypothetical protein [Nocardioides perillae]